MREKITDRELYPALWMVSALLLLAFWIWHSVGQPPISGCWFYTHLHIYCPGCGGTRAIIALLHGDAAASLYYNPSVLFMVVSKSAYLLSQTIWRLRGRRGWVLHYSEKWLWVLMWLLAANCLLRNLLWNGFGIPL